MRCQARIQRGAIQKNAVQLLHLLHNAVKANKPNEVVRLVKMGANIDGVKNENADEDGEAPLHQAAQLGNLRAIKVLLALGANKEARNFFGETPMWCAVQANHQKAFELLFNAGANKDAVDTEGRSIIHCAVDKGNLQIIEILIQAGAVVNTVTKEDEGYTPLQSAIAGKDQKAMEMLLCAGANPEAESTREQQRALHVAISNDTQRMIMALLRAGANKDAVCARGWTPLHYAVEDNKKIAMVILLAFGADRGVKDQHGKTPLHYAVTLDACDCDLVRLLLKTTPQEQKRLRNSMTPYGDTPYSIAAPKMRELLSEGLVKSDSFGWTPLMRCAYGIKQFDAEAQVRLDEALDTCDEPEYVTEACESALSVASCEKVKEYIRNAIYKNYCKLVSEVFEMDCKQPKDLAQLIVQFVREDVILPEFESKSDMQCDNHERAVNARRFEPQSDAIKSDTFAHDFSEVLQRMGLTNLQWAPGSETTMRR